MGEASASSQPPTDPRLAQAATAPLADLNVVRTDIPAVLDAARRAPYAVPVDRSCQGIAAEVRGLDMALGADVDAAPTDGGQHRVDKAVGDVAVKALSNATDVVPFRAWVRKLTGAERHSRHLAEAIAAGTVRRAFLKGMGQASNCKAPAAPAA